jgi:putative membrane protein
MMIIGIFFIWFITAVGLWLTTIIVPGVNFKRSGGLWKAAFVLGLINAFIRPVLWALTLPLTVLTFGLFALVINALMIWLTGKLVDGFEVRSFFSAFMAAIVMALLGIIAFILFQWFMMDEVNWMIMEKGTYV